jgi:hypothetical protein
MTPMRDLASIITLTGEFVVAVCLVASPFAFLWACYIMGFAG